jgi:hypothetical protein
LKSPQIRIPEYLPFCLLSKAYWIDFIIFCQFETSLTPVLYIQPHNMLSHPISIENQTISILLSNRHFSFTWYDLTKSVIYIQTPLPLLCSRSVRNKSKPFIFDTD